MPESVHEPEESDETPHGEEEASEHGEHGVVSRVHVVTSTAVEVVSNPQDLLAELAKKKYRGAIPEEHCTSIDTKVRWLWNQRFGTVQRIWMETDDAETKAAASLLLNAAYAGDMSAINIVLQRLEGGALVDEDLLDFGESMPI